MPRRLPHRASASLSTRQPLRNTRHHRSPGSSDLPVIPRRSARIAALEDRRRESEDEALRRIRERIAHTHRYVRDRLNNNPASFEIPTSRSSRGLTAARTRAFQRTVRRSTPISTGRPRSQLVRQNAIRRSDPPSIDGNTNQFPRRPPPVTSRMSTGGARQFSFAARSGSPGHDIFFVHHANANMRERLLDIGLLIGSNNRYSSDSEDSFFTPRVIDPEAISEDESEDDASTQLRELSPPVSTPEPPPVRHIVTRSMSRQPGFYDEPSSSTVPRPRLRKRKAKSCKAGDKAGTCIKTVIRVEKFPACTICCEDEPKKPVACIYCRQSIGCRYCVKKWFFTTNMSHLDQRTPYPLGGTDRNHKRCPLCRADWGDSMQIVPAVEKDAFKQQSNVEPPILSPEVTITK